MSEIERTKTMSDEARAAAERIAELEAEVEHLRAQVPPCDGGCSYGDGPQEDCSAHGRRPTDLWSLLHDEHEMGRAAHERAEAAEARLAAVRALAVDQTVTRTDRLRRILAVIEGGDEA